jgi:hypothetical protein
MACRRVLSSTPPCTLFGGYLGTLWAYKVTISVTAGILGIDEREPLKELFISYQRNGLQKTTYCNVNRIEI